MEPNLNLLDCFTGDTTAGEVKAHLEATGQRITQDGYGNLHLEAKRQRALAYLGEKHLLHPANRVQRPVVSISARGSK